MSGDGPACVAEYILIARPRGLVRVPGSRPGKYNIRGTFGCDNPSCIAGYKDIDGIRAIIRDYTLKNDLIIDPYAGSGTTLLAALIEGRRCIGAECDPNTYKLAVKRLKAGYTGELFKT
jgi:hypothetical protein